MSQEIICRECNSPNKPGSKFCNNCGKRLPKSTKILCPNCQTPNTRDRFYCDNCGARLIEQDNLAPPDKSDENRKEGATDQFLSLPMRPPGDTGELDLSQTIPDWLKGETESGLTSEEDAPPQKLPKVEEIGSPQKMTDDLPDWLVDEHDSKPIIGSPRIITTEHYLNLIEESGDETAADMADVDETAEKAALPDWLADMAAPPTKDEVITSGDKSTTEDALAEWLADISQSGLEDEETETAVTGDRAASEQTDTNSGDRGNAPPVVSDETADWLAGILPDSDELAPPSPTAADQPTEEQNLEEEMFDWLAESLPETGNLAESTGPASDSTEDEPGIDDWLADFGLPDTGSLTDSPDESPDNRADQDTPDADSAIPDWLSDEEIDTVDSGALSDLADAVAQQDIGQPDATLSEWMSDLMDSEGASDTVESEFPLPDTDSLPDWMAEFTAADTNGFTEPAADGLDEEFTETAVSETPTIDSEDPFAGSETAWLRGFEFDDDDQPAPTAPDETEPTDVPEQPEQAIEPEPELEPEPPATGPLPDWLTGGEDESLTTDDSGFGDLFSQDDATNADLDWLTDNETAADDTPPPDEETEPAALLSGDTDWLSEFTAMGDEAFSLDEDGTTADDGADGADDSEEPAAAEAPQEDAPSPEFEADMFAADWPEETPDDDAAPQDLAPSPQAQTDGAWLDADSMLEDALQDEMPDWLDELGPPIDATSPPEQEDVADNESLPAWLAQMKPGTAFSGSGLSDMSELEDLSSALGSSLGSDMDSADLPDWLEGADELPGAFTSLDASPDIPEWLKSEGEVGDSDHDLINLGSQPPLDASSEWTSVLQDLPPAESVKDSLTPANIPDWILELKPGALTGEEPVPEAEKPAVAVGPLTGIRDAIMIEPAIARPYERSGRPAFTITNEQRAQTALLKQLSLVERETSGSVHIATPRLAVSIWLRILLAGLLTAAIAIGLLRPNLLEPAPLTAPPHVDAAYTAVQAAAGQPVLLAVEYTPALAGELEAQAAMLAEQLAANGSPVVTVSQYAAGTAVAQTNFGDQPTLGLLPGDSIGLRQLSDCLSLGTACNEITGRNLDSVMQQTLSDVGLIIVLTGERDSLVNWLEQVGGRTTTPMVAGLTQSLGPVAAPYFASGQLAGMIVGLPDTAVYQQTIQSQPTDAVSRQLSAQTLAQLVAALALLIGGLGHGAIGLFRRGEAK